MRTAYVFDLDDTLMPTAMLFSQPRNRQLLQLADQQSHAGGREPRLQAAYHQIISPDPYLTHLLHGLHGPKYLFTNGTRMHARCAMQAMGVGQLFDGQLDRDGTLGELKPSPHVYGIMQKAVQQHCGNCSRIVFFDDLVANLQQGKRFGWYTVWVGPTAAAAHSNPYGVDMRFDTVYSALVYLMRQQHAR